MAVKVESKGKREPNGRLSRKRKERQARYVDGLDKLEREMIAVGTEARQRIFGLSAKLSRDQLAGSAVGRLVLGDMLTRIQSDAAFLYEQDARAYYLTIEGPQQPSAVDLDRVQGISNGENVKRKLVAKARYEAARTAVQEAQNAVRLHSNMFGAIQHCVMMDHEPATEAMMGSLREALNALVRHYGLNGNVGKRAA